LIRIVASLLGTVSLELVFIYAARIYAGSDLILQQLSVLTSSSQTIIDGTDLVNERRLSEGETLILDSLVRIVVDFAVRERYTIFTTLTAYNRDRSLQCFDVNTNEFVAGNSLTPP
jgi:hypothetical protein